jgi:CheY-like chemotaxis protein
LIITDFMMPVMTGLDLASAVRAEGQICDVPIIWVSGAQAQIGRSHPDLFQAVVDKPYNDETLLTEVRRLMANC